MGDLSHWDRRTSLCLPGRSSLRAGTRHHHLASQGSRPGTGEADGTRDSKWRVSDPLGSDQ